MCNQLQACPNHHLKHNKIKQKQNKTKCLVEMKHTIKLFLDWTKLNVFVVAHYHIMMCIVQGYQKLL